MKRPFLTGAVFVFTGAVCAVCLNIFAAAVAGALELAVCAAFLKRKNLKFINYIYLFVCLAVMFIVFYNTRHKLSLSFYEKQLEKSNGEECIIYGKVSAVNSKGQYIQLRLSRCRIMLEESGQCLEEAGVLIYVDSFDGFVGDNVKVCGHLEAFGRQRNEGGFDVRAYYHSVGLDYACVAKYSEITKKGENETYRVIKRFSKYIAQVFDSILDKEEAGILASVILGDKSNLDNNIKLLYQTSGIAHILAISGLHVSVIGLSLYCILKKLLPFFLAAVLGGMVMTAYLLMTGNGISVFRAVVMFIIAVSAEVIGRTYDLATALSVAGMLLIFDDGRVIMNMGFWLSFTALAGICWVFPVLSKVFNKYKEKKVRAKILDTVLASVAVQLSTLPVVLWCYYQIPVFGFLLNLIVIPLMSLLMISGVLAGLIGLFSTEAALFVIGGAHYILKFYKLLCSWYVKIPNGIWVTGRPKQISIVIYIFVSVIILIYFYNIDNKRKMKHKLASIVIFMAALLSLRRQPEHGMLVNMIDVGQGDSIFVRTDEGFTCLFDGGSLDVKNAGSKRILPYLKSQGIKKLDYIIVSHSDSDHINGILELIETQDSAFSVKEIVLPDIQANRADDNYVRFVEEARKYNIKISYASAQGSIQNGKYFSLTCVHPEKNYNFESANDYSAVYLLQYKNFKMLFTGDAELKAEKHMIESSSKNLFCDINILKTGHHGSRSSSGEEFLKIIKPEAALISCGADNSYGHPHNQTLERLREIGCNFYITARLGAIKVVTDGNKYTIKSFLKTNH
ncbi:MAG: DNA internalization-related competence protein ComEC/Rec2 [Eubacteriales bacterium]|nr:DNA internalization-related competence protein ComEC/Rec2 [Eubacteriales bacterium]